MAAVVWWFVFRDTSPAAPTLEGAVAGATSTTAPDPSAPALVGIEGAWALSGDGTS
ncbi:MAG: hypothetical protein MUP76_04235 [Acidimicrobiia bacterium]|nr:hypothetical protein [Acidimicrobiia bacterium]